MLQRTPKPKPSQSKIATAGLAPVEKPKSNPFQGYDGRRYWADLNNRSIGPFETENEAFEDLVLHLKRQREWCYRLEEFQRLRDGSKRSSIY